MIQDETNRKAVLAIAKRDLKVLNQASIGIPYYCTARAMDWLLSRHVGPILYRPVDFILNNTTHYHRFQIEQTKGNAELEYIDWDEDTDAPKVK